MVSISCRSIDIHLYSLEQAANNLGIPSIPDYNSATVPSASCAALDIGTDQNMHRVSSYSAFLPPKLANSRKHYLKVCPETLGKRIVFDKGQGGRPRAIGVEFFQCRRDDPVGDTYYAKARKEVVVCCGAIATPQFLMLR
jgi:choline dehydrogenase-like flavoprotein